MNRLSLFVLLVVAQPCEALTRVTYSGIISEGADYNGVFGLGKSLAGKAATFTMLFDYTVGRTIGNGEGLFYAMDPATLRSPGRSGILTVGGVRYEIMGEHTVGSTYVRHNSRFPDTFEHFFGNYNCPSEGCYSGTRYIESYMRGIIWNSDSNFIINPDPNQNFSHLTSPHDSAYGEFYINKIDLDTFNNVRIAYGLFRPDSIQISTIPESPTWLSMIFGFFGIGIFGRRKYSSNSTHYIASS